MELAKQPTVKNRNRAMLKAGIFLAFIILAISLIRFTPIKNYLTAQALGHFLETAGYWAPVLFMLIYTVGVCVFLPGTTGDFYMSGLVPCWEQVLLSLSDEPWEGTLLPRLSETGSKNMTMPSSETVLRQYSTCAWSISHSRP